MQPRVVAISLLWMLMVLAAHPVGILERAANGVWAWLVPWGLDVAMTPLTADMTLMHENRGDSFYRRTARVMRLGSSGWEQVPWSDVGFYEVRVPLLLMAEVVANQWRVEGHVAGVCWQLNRRWPGTRAFRYELLPARPADERLGLSKDWSCAQ